MTEAERIAMFVEATTPGPERWWYLSFADPDRPTGQHFLGVALVRATCHADAVRMAWRNGCNPGGQVLGHPVPYESGDPPEAMRHRLVSDSAELDRLMVEWTGEGVATLAEIEARK